MSGPLRRRKRGTAVLVEHVIEHVIEQVTPGCLDGLVIAVLQAMGLGWRQAEDCSERGKDLGWNSWGTRTWLSSRDSVSPPCSIKWNPKINFVPGLYKIFDEILVNACDNFQRDPDHMTYIKAEPLQTLWKQRCRRKCRKESFLAFSWCLGLLTIFWVLFPERQWIEGRFRFLFGFVKVNINEEEGWVSIENNGSTLPVEIHKDFRTLSIFKFKTL